MNLIQWIVEQKLAKNEFAAAHLANGLKLSEVKDFESQQARVRLYRDWRNSFEMEGKLWSKDFDELAAALEA